MEKIRKEDIILALENKLERDVELTSHLYNDLGMDSLDMAEFVTDLSDKLGSEVPEEVAEAFHTVEDVWKYVEKVQQ